MPPFVSSASRTRAALASPYLLLSLTALFWSGNWVIGRAVHESVPPMALALWRWATALLFMLPFAWPHVRRAWPIIRRHWRRLHLARRPGAALATPALH